MKIIIPISANDVHSFLRCYPYLMKNFQNSDILVIGSKAVIDEISFYGLPCLDEENVLPGLTYNSVYDYIFSLKHGAVKRTGWYYQQFLKMAFALCCEDEYYMVWDADTIPLKSLTFFDSDNKPFLDYLENQNADLTYFETLANLMPNNPVMRVKKLSFVTEHMVFNTKIMRELIYKLSSYGIRKNVDFWKNILLAVNSKKLGVSGFSEFETYANYVLNYYPNTYHLRKWNNLRSARSYIGDSPSDRQLAWIAPYFDVASIEDFCPKIIFSYIVFKFGINMYLYYRILNPILNVWFRFREFLRKLIK